MTKNGSGRAESDLEAGIAKANGIIANLARRDDVDTSEYGFKVKKAGKASLALHRGTHPSEEVVAPANGSRDPRVPKAKAGISLSGALKTDLMQEIEQRHEELVRLHRWWMDMAGRTPVATDFRWDPVMLEMIRLHHLDPDELVARGPGEFVNKIAARDYPGVEHLVQDDGSDDVAFLGCVDGDVVRALRIRYAAGIFYSWKRSQPDHVELLVKDRRLPQTVLTGLSGASFMTVVEHASLASVKISGYAQIGDTISFKAATRLVRP